MTAGTMKTAMITAATALAVGIGNTAYAWDYYDGTYIWSFHWINSNTQAELQNGNGGRGVSYGVNYSDGHGVYADSIETGGAPVGTIAVPTNVCINTNGRGGGTLEWYPVTSLGRNVFSGCGGLTDISIPDCITNVGANCFKGCVGLTTLHLPESIVAIGTYAFQNCSNMTSLTLPRNLAQIDRGVFMGCARLTSIELPDRIASIPYRAFRDCASLTSISMPIGLTAIGSWAFQDCVSLEYIVIPENVTEVGTYAFTGCVGLKKAFVPISLQGKLGLVNGMETAFDDFSVVEYYYGSAADIQLPSSDPAAPSTPAVVPEPEPGPEVSYAGEMATAFDRAQTVTGALYREGSLVGTVEVKVGKISKKKTVKVSASASVIDDGKVKKITAKPVTLTLEGEGGALRMTSAATLVFKAPIGEMTFDMGANGVFTLENATYRMVGKTVGGNWTRTDAGVHVAATGDLPEGTIEELLPAGEPVIPKGGKWSFNKNATVKLSKDKTTHVLDDTKGKTNRSSMKLTYTPKTGVFKGSFKLYALEGADGKKKLKKYTVNVIGLVVDGRGTGEATCKRPKLGPWTVTVEYD